MIVACMCACCVCVSVCACVCMSVCACCVCMSVCACGVCAFVLVRGEGGGGVSVLLFLRKIRPKGKIKYMQAVEVSLVSPKRVHM